MITVYYEPLHLSIMIIGFNSLMCTKKYILNDYKTDSGGGFIIFESNNQDSTGSSLAAGNGGVENISYICDEVGCFSTMHL